MIAFNRFQGDPAIKITSDGASMTFIGGQPVMDQGLNNAVLISLFTKPGWWGNTLFRKDTEKIGSEYQKTRTIIDVSTITDVEQSANDALQWMNNLSLVSNIDITAINPYGDQIVTSINIFPPGQDSQEFVFTQNGLAWIGQTFYPAHERLA